MAEIVFIAFLSFFQQVLGRLSLMLQCCKFGECHTLMHFWCYLLFFHVSKIGKEWL